MTVNDLELAITDKNFSNFDSETERCLWLAKVRGWEEAHEIVESLPEPAASWIHAMFHREEGDVGNAMYWYSKANKTMPSSNLSYEQEWLKIATEVLS